MNGLVVEFLTRDGCHLCEEALPKVEEAARRARITVRTVDIDTDDFLTGMFGLRIPVVLSPEGTVLVEGAMPPDLVSVFRSWRRGQTGRPRLFRRRR